VRNFFSKKNLKVIGIEVIGCMLIAVGIYNFAVMAEFPMTGFTGLAILINHLTDFHIGLSLILLNIPMAIVCYRLLGRRFLLHSIFCIVLYSLMIDYVAPLFPTYHGNRLLAALACGVISGTGFALIFRQNSSTGGTSFVGLAITARFPHLSLGKILLVIDFIPIVLGGFLFRPAGSMVDIDSMIYGTIVAFLASVVIDRLIYGANAGKLLLIVTDDSALIRRTIEETSGRGCTIWQAKGGYRGDNREVVMCACDNTQMYQVQKAVAAADERAFTVVLESSQVAGEGFRRLVVGEKQG